VEFSAYQRAASETSQLRLGGPQGAIAPMLGLASESESGSPAAPRWTPRSLPSC
jgi:hypothetical protein